MKNKHFFFSLVFLVSLLVGLKLFYPSPIIACESYLDCDSPPPGNCTGGSRTCDQGVCKYTWNCTNTCPAWTAWSPDPCTQGQEQTRFCVQYQGVYQIQRCGVGGGGQADTQNGPSCTGNYVVDYTQPVDSMCGLPWKDVNYVPGNAQRQEGCCQMAGGKEIKGEWYCCKWNKYNQCTKQCRDTEVTEEYCAKNTWTTYACKLNCDVNAWGAWSACSATCGGGTQYRINACGTYQWQSCNTQSCQGPWWQVKDGDVTATGDIISRMPAGYYFNIVGSGGFPGVPVYGGQIAVVPGTISAKRWNANTTTSEERVFNYSYFENLIPADVVSGQLYSDGYRWEMITGNHTLPLTNFGATKNILFVNGNLTIDGNINLDDDAGFFLAIVKGAITINPTVTEIEGIYETDSGFNTGLGTVPLHVRGSVVSYGGISMQRDLPDDTTTPSELFEFAPDQILLYPDKLGFRTTRWSEVAP